MSFPITKCAMEGFQVMQRAPLAVIAWVVLYLVIIGLMFWGMFAGMGQAGLLTAFGVGSPPPVSDPTEALKALAPMMAVLGLMMPVSIVIGTMMSCAILRAVLRPQDKAFFYLRLGGDEVRIFVVGLVFYILALGVFGVLLSATVVGCIAEWQSSKGLSVLIGFVGACAAIAAAVFFWNKLCLSFPATFATRSIRVFDGWKLSQGRFWPLVGMNMLALLLSAAVGFGVGMIALIFQFSAMGGAIATQGSTPNFTGPAMIGLAVSFGVRMIGAVLQMVLTYAPAAAAYREIVQPTQAADAF